MLALFYASFLKDAIKATKMLNLKLLSAAEAKNEIRRAAEIQNLSPKTAA